jgi:hypothetical protein
VDYHAGLAETLLRLPRFRREEAAMLARTRMLLDVVGLSDFADEQARNLPFGHQRRLEIARALALRPKLLLLDEPAAGLTHGEIEDLVALIRGLADRGIPTNSPVATVRSTPRTASIRPYDTRTPVASSNGVMRHPWRAPRARRPDRDRLRSPLDRRVPAPADHPRSPRHGRAP